MKLTSCTAGGVERVAVVDAHGEQVRLLPERMTMFDAVTAGTDVVAGLVSRAQPVSLSTVTLRAPIPVPRRNVFCTGWNYVAHFEEGRAHDPDRVYPEAPCFFSKASTSVIGSGQQVPLHAHVTRRLDYEAELAVIIGRAGADVAEADALGHVFGYTAANDVSARDIQRRHGAQWFKGKSLDGTCPLGPWIVTTDEIGDAQALEIVCRVNGEVTQHANSSQMYFTIPRLIAELSAGMTLLPGDIILTGTPDGVGNSRTPPRYLKAGDVMEVEIAGIGMLSNPVGP